VSGAFAGDGCQNWCSSIDALFAFTGEMLGYQLRLYPNFSHGNRLKKIAAAGRTQSE
jgi:hypothetical protein